MHIYEPTVMEGLSHTIGQSLNEQTYLMHSRTKAFACVRKSIFQILEVRELAREYCHAQLTSAIEVKVFNANQTNRSYGGEASRAFGYALLARSIGFQLILILN